MKKSGRYIWYGLFLFFTPLSAFFVLGALFCLNSPILLLTYSFVALCFGLLAFLCFRMTRKYPPKYAPSTKPGISDEDRARAKALVDMGIIVPSAATETVHMPVSTPAEESYQVKKTVRGKWLFISIPVLLAALFVLMFLIAALRVRDWNMAALFAILALPFCLFYIYCLRKMPGFTEDEKQAKAAELAELKKAEQRRREERDARRLEKLKDREPVAAALLRTRSINKITRPGGFLCTMLGYPFLRNIAIFMNLGSFEEATFAVRYESGRIGEETVKVGSDRYKQLQSLVSEDQDLE